MENNLGDLKISGAGSASGGKFNMVKLSGASEIKGDIECVELHSSGASDIKGNVKAKIVKTSGASKIVGNVSAEEIRSSGASDIKGDVNTSRIKSSGASDIKGNLHAEEVEISGASSINGDCEAETFKARGGFDIGGLLNAGIIDIEVNGKCRVREIGGESIKVYNGKNYGGILTKIIKYLSNQEERLITSIIEGDEIYLEVTDAKIVRGNTVEIGPGCKIETIEYRDSIKISNEAQVGKNVKVD